MEITSTCAQCGVEFTYERGRRGRARKFCSQPCGNRSSYLRLPTEEQSARRLARRDQLKCALCAQPMFRAGTSSPQGQAMHNACRRRCSRAKRDGFNAGYKFAKALVAEYLQVSIPNVKPRATTSERGYGNRHQRARKDLLAQLVDGTPCAFCGEGMYVAQQLDLDHSDPEAKLRREPGDRLAHAVCNRRDGSVRGNKKRERPGPRLSACVICGDAYRYRRTQRTCGRACGLEYRRRNSPVSHAC